MNGLQSVVGGILIKEEKIILTKRASSVKNFPNYWEFPGGKVENGETLIQALIRELQEELNIIVNEKSVIGFPNNQLKTEQFTLTLFLINQWENEITLDPKIHSEMLTVEANQLNTFDSLLPTDKILIEPFLDFLHTE